MRIRTLLLALLVTSSMGAQAQVVSPLGGSNGTPQRAAPPAPAATPAAPSTTTTAPTATAPATTTAPAAASAPAHPRKTFAERFAAANTTHDGKLTLEQARTGHLRAVVRDFDQIDKSKRGYVTLDEIKAHQAAQRAARRAAKPTTPAH